MGEVPSGKRVVGRPRLWSADPEIQQRIEVMLERGLTTKRIRSLGLNRPMSRTAWWFLVKKALEDTRSGH